MWHTHFPSNLIVSRLHAPDDNGNDKNAYDDYDDDDNDDDGDDDDGDNGDDDNGDNGDGDYNDDDDDTWVVCRRWSRCFSHRSHWSWRPRRGSGTSPKAATITIIMIDELLVVLGVPPN